MVLQYIQNGLGQVKKGVSYSLAALLLGFACGAAEITNETDSYVVPEREIRDVVIYDSVSGMPPEDRVWWKARIDKNGVYVGFMRSVYGHDERYRINPTPGLGWVRDGVECQLFVSVNREPETSIGYIDEDCDLTVDRVTEGGEEHDVKVSDTQNYVDRLNQLDVLEKISEQK